MRWALPMNHGDLRQRCVSNLMSEFSDPSSREPVSGSPKTLSVLLVEDNPADAELCLRELKRAGWKLRSDVVRSPEEFNARLAAASYDVVIADASLPSWSGLEAFQALKGLRRDVPFILFTGTMRDEEAARTLESGVADYVLKSGLARIGPAVQSVLERRALRAENELLKRRLESAVASGGTSPSLAEFNPCAVIELSAEGVVREANKTVTEMARALGRERPEELLPPDAASIARTCLASGHKRVGVEVALSGRVLSCAFHPITSAQVVHCHVTDVTERQRLEAQLRHAQKLESVGRLAAGIAHDFNNVLTVIQGHTGLLRNIPAVSPAMGESVQGIARAAERGSKLTSQLLAFSRRNVLQLQAVDLNDVLTGLSTLLPRTLGEDITYQFQYASELPVLHADRGLIEQVFMNLAVNARDAMPRGGQLMVSTALVDIDAGYVERHPTEAREGRFVCLTISDTGCGMDQMTLSRLFEPFFTTKEFGKGTGLGLATVFGIVKQHQGWIEVRSQLGQGTSFMIYLPPASGAEARSNAAATEPARLQGHETIMLVEDEPPVRWIIKEVLTQYGYNVLEAGSGVEALAQWHQHHAEIKLLLTDMVMPVGLGGQELAEKFVSQRPDLKVIFISGYSPQVAGKGFKVLDGLNFLQKPFDGARLALAVRQSLDG